MLFVWPASDYDTQIPVSPPAPDYYQTWMGTRVQAFGTYSAAKDAYVVANYNCFSDQVLPDLGFAPIDALRDGGAKQPRTGSKGLIRSSIDFLKDVVLEIRGER